MYFILFGILLNPDPEVLTSDLMRDRKEKALKFLQALKHGFFAKIVAWIYGAVWTLYFSITIFAALPGLGS